MSSMYTTHPGHRKNYVDVFLELLLATDRSAVAMPPELDDATLPEARLNREQDHIRTLQSNSANSPSRHPDSRTLLRSTTSQPRQDAVSTLVNVYDCLR